MLSARTAAYYVCTRDLQSFEIRFESAVPIRFDSKVIGQLENFRIGRACPLLVVVKPLTALIGTVYRLASSISDHTPVLFNVFEDWNEKSVVPHISFDSIRTHTADSQVPSLHSADIPACYVNRTMSSK